MTWLIVWGFIKRFWPALLVLAVVTYVAWMFHGYRDEISRLTYEVERKTVQMQMLKMQRDDAIKGIDACNNSVNSLREQEQEYLDRIEELMSQPPEVIVRYRDRVVRIEDEINANTCEGAVEQLGQALKDALHE